MALRAPGARSLLAALAKCLPPWVLQLLIGKFSFFVGGLLSGLSLFVEEKRRREELAMYVLPKGLESAWVMARGKGWVFGMGRYGDALVSTQFIHTFSFAGKADLFVELTAMGMGMVMVSYEGVV